MRASDPIIVQDDDFPVSNGSIVNEAPEIAGLGSIAIEWALISLIREVTAPARSTTVIRCSTNSLA